MHSERRSSASKRRNSKHIHLYLSIRSSSMCFIYRCIYFDQRRSHVHVKTYDIVFVIESDSSDHHLFNRIRTTLTHYITFTNCDNTPDWSRHDMWWSDAPSSTCRFRFAFAFALFAFRLAHYTFHPSILHPIPIRLHNNLPRGRLPLYFLVHLRRNLPRVLQCGLFSRTRTPFLQCGLFSR